MNADVSRETNTSQLKAHFLANRALLVPPSAEQRRLQAAKQAARRALDDVEKVTEQLLGLDVTRAVRGA